MVTSSRDENLEPAHQTSIKRLSFQRDYGLFHTTFVEEDCCERLFAWLTRGEERRKRSTVFTMTTVTPHSNENRIRCLTKRFQS